MTKQTSIAAIAAVADEMGVDAFKARLIAELKSLATDPEFCYVTKAQISLSKMDFARCSYNAGPKQFVGDSGLTRLFADNTEEQNKGCIFGRALRAMGVELGDEQSNIGVLLAPVLGRKFSDKCWDMQSEQDSGAKWSSIEFSELEGL